MPRMARMARMAPSATIQKIAEELRTRLEELYGSRLHEVVLYGSQARGDATEASDVDIMVVLEGEVDAWTELQRMAKPVYDLELEMEEMITLYPIARAEFEHRDHPLLQNVHRDGVKM